MKQENKKPVGRPKGTKKDIKFWCEPKDRETIYNFIQSLNKKTMKKTLIILAILLFVSCTEDTKNCDEDIKKLTEQYYTAIGNANGYKPAIEHLKEQFEKKKNEVYKNCK